MRLEDLLNEVKSHVLNAFANFSQDYKPTILIHDYHSPPLESSFGNSTAKKEFGDTRDEHMSPQAFSVEDQEEREQLSEDFVRLLEERKRLEEELLNLDKMRNITKINTLLKQKDLEPNNRHLLDNYSTAVVFPFLIFFAKLMIWCRIYQIASTLIPLNGCI